MTGPLYTRLSAASGALFIVCFNAALFDLGAPPKASDSTREIASLLVRAHGRILHGMYLAGLAIMLGIWFFATVQTWLQQTAGKHSTQHSSAALGSGLLAIGLGVLGMLLFYGATYKIAGQGNAGFPVVRALTDAGNAAIELTKFPLAMFILAVSLAAQRAELLPRWFTRAGAVSVVILIASAIPLFAKGSFTQFGGGLDVIGAIPGVLWIFVLSLMMTKPRVDLGPVPG
ncbi:MAG TPA: hypothetical protein VGF95_02900 [Solirubrobacteraceae bacterium]|jgi:hypothetical protein